MASEGTAPVVCFGEVLWDALPRGLFLGGAPLNVSAHLAALGRPSAMVSAVGLDFLGDEALERLQKMNVQIELIERLSDYGTGVVKAVISETGDARYDIIQDKAWDHISSTPAVCKAVAAAPAMVFGSLASRREVTKSTLLELLEIDGPLRFFDVNLRPPYGEHALVKELLAYADVVKLNRDELLELSGQEDREDLGEIIRTFSAQTSKSRICVTDGGAGAWFFDSGTVHHAEATPVEVRDTVGAGDAFSARLLDGLLREEPITETLEAATKRGSWVASKDGAVPLEEG